MTGQLGLMEMLAGRKLIESIDKRVSGSRLPEIEWSGEAVRNME